MRGKVLGAVTALVFTAIPATGATAAPGAPPPPSTGSTRSTASTDEVTLVTGDKVRVKADGQVASITPGPGRTHIRFRSYVDGNQHTLVVPEDTIGPLAADRLDRRLFDVTQLLEFGYRDRMPLIVDGRARLGARTADDWAALKTEDSKIWLDGIRKPSLDRSVKQIGAPAAHQRGLTGQGVKVAVVDTGVDQNHPDLKGRELAERNFTPDPDNTDNVGHGTHVGSTIASTSGQYGGVAPGAQLLDAKVCVEFGCQESWILDGMRWAAEQGAQVVNMSLGGSDTPEVDPLEEAINTLTDKYGTLFVVAAGNSGGTGTVSSPSTAEAALSVGAVDRDDKLADFSSKGPRVGDSGLKPDVTAPGVGIVAAKAGTTDHLAASGTSMATPHVAGAAALLRQQHPDWTAAQIKSVLATTAKPAAGVPAFDQGAGRIDVAKAIDQKVFAESVSVNFGLQQWPHGDDKPVTKQLTYRNTTDAAVTLNLKLTTNAPAGMFTLGGTTVTVPAKGTATVPLTGDTRAGTTDGQYTGELVATSGAHTVRTLLGIDREVESYNLALDYTDRDGNEPTSAVTYVAGLDKPYFNLSFGAGDRTLRLPRGTYLVETSVGAQVGFDMLVTPTLTLTGDQKIVADMRLAKPLSVTVPEPTGDFVPGEVSYRRSVNDEVKAGSGIVSFSGLDSIRTGQIGAPLPAKDLSSMVVLHANTVADPTVYYRLAYPVAGSLPNGLTKAPAKKDLARVEHTIGGREPGGQAIKGQMPLSVHGVGGGSALYPVPEGANAVEYLTTEDVRWSPFVVLNNPSGARSDQEASPRQYRAGKSYTEHLVRPVFSPSIPGQYPVAARYQNQAFVAVPLVTDANHGVGRSVVDSARTALYREGVLVGESPSTGASFGDLPPREASYRAEMSLDRSSKFEFSTKVSAAWTFRSKATTGTRSVPLPLSVVRFEPKLDAAGAVPAGTLQRIKLLTQSQAGAGKIRDIKVEYSFDDGKSWRRAGVVGKDALVYHPNGARYASLRASATDSKGNTVELTVIRAYKVG